MDTKPLSCKNDETQNICFPTPTCFLKYHALELKNYFRLETSAEPCRISLCQHIDDFVDRLVGNAYRLERCALMPVIGTMQLRTEVNNQVRPR